MKKLLYSTALALLRRASRPQRKTPAQQTQPEGYRVHRRQADPHRPRSRTSTAAAPAGATRPSRSSKAKSCAPAGRPVHLSEMWIVRHTFMDKGREIRPHARRDQLRRGRRFARRDRRNQEPRHRTAGGLSGLQLRHRESRFPRTVARAEGLPRRRDHSQRQILGQSAFDGMETRLRRHPRRVFRPDARNIHLRGQGVYAPVVRRIAADRHGRLHRHHAPSRIIRSIRSSSSRFPTTGCGARSTTCRSTR